MVPDGAVLALDISGSRALLAAHTQHGLGSVLEVRNTSGEAAGYWPEIRAAAVRLARDGGARAVGVSFGGPVDRNGRVVSIHVGGWSSIDVGAELAGSLGVPVRVENDANCGAIGEARYGAWDEPHTLVFMTCSTGIGGGIVSGGRLLKGARGMAGEVGHIVVRPEGLPCSCGSVGCLEAMCSGSAIGRRATAALAADPNRPTLLRQAAADGVIPGAKPVFEAAASGDSLARAVLEAVFVDFGRGIAAVHNVFDPDLIVIGGGVSLAGEALTRPVTKAALPWVMEHRRTQLRVEVASLGLTAQLWGAAALAWDSLDG